MMVPNFRPNNTMNNNNNNKRNTMYRPHKYRVFQNLWTLLPEVIS